MHGGYTHACMHGMKSNCTQCSIHTHKSECIGCTARMTRPPAGASCAHSDAREPSIRNPRDSTTRPMTWHAKRLGCGVTAAPRTTVLAGRRLRSASAYERGTAPKRTRPAEKAQGPRGILLGGARSIRPAARQHAQRTAGTTVGAIRPLPGRSASRHLRCAWRGGGGSPCPPALGCHCRTTRAHAPTAGG